MFTHHVLIIFLAGILCKSGNVWAEDLDLNSPLNSGFSVNTTTNNGLIYTEISSNTEKYISRVKNTLDTLWEEKEGQICMGVTLVSSPKLDDTLVLIEVLTSDGFVNSYYKKMGNLYLQIVEGEYNKKIRDMEIVSTDNTTQQGTDSKDTSSKDTEDSTSNLGSNLEANTQNTHKSDNKSRNVSELDVPSRRILNILGLDSNDRISYEYEINDGIPCLIVEVLKPKNKRITAVSENEVLIWVGSDSERLLTLSAHSFYGDYRLVEVIYTSSEQSDNFSNYYKKYDNQWLQCDSQEFENTYMDMKNKIEIVGSVVLDVSAPPNLEEFYLKHETSDLLQATTFFPLTGYHLKQVVDKDKQVWKSDSKRSTAVTLITSISSDLTVNMLKIEITNDRKDSFKYFMKDNSGNYTSINKDTYNKIIKDPQSHFNQLNGQVLNSDSTHFDTLSSETPKPSNSSNLRKVGMELDIMNHDLNYVLVDTRKGVEFRTFTPYNGLVFTSIKYLSNIIWKAQNGQSSTFVRVFFPSGTPRLGFVNINIDPSTDNSVNGFKSGNSDIVTSYFVDDYGTWKFVDFETFSTHFDFYSNNAVPTPDSSAESQVQCPLKEADPLSFFIFDINTDQNP
ncbi:Tash-like protein, putative [Theileria annulata]|uniref:Tash-like protein, putative n=1 Tax=Theileria annulata TaxID=5874 RepID=Q4UHF3_THEAN|nr:Tash-like protein, putative [Theileria annulata]CAI73486.1 Tash-like protein, putative [Theileria annulata]|eukprot:XP_954163.1 Tash-like protein, putative [Theileria annulata]